MPEELAHEKTNVQFWTTKCQFYKILHVDFGFDYFSHNKLDEPDLNLVSILDFYHFRGLQSNVQDMAKIVSKMTNLWKVLKLPEMIQVDPR